MGFYHKHAPLFGLSGMVSASSIQHDIEVFVVPPV